MYKNKLEFDDFVKLYVDFYAYHLASCHNCMDSHLVSDRIHYLSTLYHSYRIVVVDKIPANLSSYLIHSNFSHSIAVRYHVNSTIAVDYNSYMASAAYDSMKREKIIDLFDNQVKVIHIN